MCTCISRLVFRGSGFFPPLQNEAGIFSNTRGKFEFSLLAFRANTLSFDLFVHIVLWIFGGQCRKCRNSCCPYFTGYLLTVQSKRCQTLIIVRKRATTAPALISWIFGDHCPKSKI